MNARQPMERAEALRKSVVLSSLECLMKHECDPEVRAWARKRYLALTDSPNVVDLETRRGG